MATAMNYLQLVNRAIAESRVSLDPLDSTTFPSPPRTVMYNNFKNWVNDAYQELFEDRPEWKFRIERTTVSIYPRVFVLANGGYVPLVGDTLVGNSSGVTFTVVGVHTFEESTEAQTLEFTLSITLTNSSNPSSLILKETFNKTSGTPVPSAATLMGIGRYDFRDIVSGLQDIDWETVRVSYPPVRAVELGRTLNEAQPVYPVAWTDWLAEYELYPWTSSQPRYIAQTPQGSYSLYPQPEEEMLLSFNYRREINPLVLHSDIPEGIPKEYHMYLVWKAVEEYADYDKNSALYMRARKKVDKYTNYLQRDELPEVFIAGWNGVRHRG